MAEEVHYELWSAGSRRNGPIAADETSQAELHWIKHAQEEKYASELHSLREKQKTNRQEIFSSSAYPFYDTKEVMSITGRLQDSTLPNEVKHTVLLPFDHRLAVLIVESAYRKLLHAGVQDTLTELRERFWIQRGRQLVKKPLFRCRVAQSFEPSQQRLRQHHCR